MSTKGGPLNTFSLPGWAPPLALPVSYATGLSEPVPEKLKLLQNIFWQCFTCFIEMDRI